jgi:hypothetical protein
VRNDYSKSLLIVFLNYLDSHCGRVQEKREREREMFSLVCNCVCEKVKGAMGQITIKTSNPKGMSSLLVFNRVYRLDIQSVMLVFSTGIVYHCPSNLLSG